MTFEEFRGQVKQITGHPFTMDMMLQRVPVNFREAFIEGLYFGLDCFDLLRNFDDIIDMVILWSIPITQIFIFMAQTICLLMVCNVAAPGLFEWDDFLRQRK